MFTIEVFVFVQLFWYLKTITIIEEFMTQNGNTLNCVVFYCRSFSSVSLYFLNSVNYLYWTWKMRYFLALNFRVSLLNFLHALALASALLCMPCIQEKSLRCTWSYLFILVRVTREKLLLVEEKPETILTLNDSACMWDTRDCRVFYCI